MALQRSFDFQEPVKILEFKVIPDAVGKFPTGKRGDIINFNLRLLLNLSLGEWIKVRTFVDGVSTALPPWEDMQAPRDYVNEEFETDGSAQLARGLGYNPLTGHKLEIRISDEYFTSAKARFFTETERKHRPLIALGGIATVFGAIGAVVYLKKQ